MKIISFFIISFIILLNTTRLYANHSYYCNCEPPAKGTCQCNSQNDHPVTWSSGQIAGKVGLAPYDTTTLWINCIGKHAVEY